MSTRPEVYTALERAMRLFDLDEGSRWIAAKLQGVAHPAAREAVTLLRAGEREAARAALERALNDMAGPADGSALGWWQPDAAGQQPHLPPPATDTPAGMRRHIALSHNIEREDKVLLLGLPDAELDTLRSLCTTMPQATAAALCAACAQAGKPISQQRVCVYLAYLGRKRGEGRSLPRPNRTGPREAAGRSTGLRGISAEDR